MKMDSEAVRLYAYEDGQYSFSANFVTILLNNVSLFGCVVKFWPKLKEN